MAKLNLEFVPGKGALPLLLGADRQSIARTMRDLGYVRSSHHGSVDYYLRNAVQIEFDEDGLASFIGVAPVPEIEVLYWGRAILHLPAIEVFNLLGQNEPGPPAEYTAQEYLFRHQIITLWDADEQYGDLGSTVPVWGQIGIGNQSYLAAIDEIAERRR